MFQIVAIYFVRCVKQAGRNRKTSRGGLWLEAASQTTAGMELGTSQLAGRGAGMAIVREPSVLVGD